MLRIVLAHLLSTLAGWPTEWAVWLVFGLINMGIAILLTSIGSRFLLKRGVNLEVVERWTAKEVSGFFFITGVVEGVAKILVSLIVFRWLRQEPGLVMLSIFILLQFIPLPKALPGTTEMNIRGASRGVIVGLVVGWWLYFPKALSL